MRFLKGLLKRVVAVLLLLITAGVIFGVLAVQWLDSAAGSSFVRQQALTSINESIQGNADFATLTRDGSTLTLTKFKLFTPEGELVLEVPRLTVTIELTALINKQINIESLLIESPSAHLVNDDRGLNVNRAIASRSTAAAAPGEPLHLGWNVKHFELKDGAVEFKTDQQLISSSKLELSGQVSGSTPPLTMKINSALTGQLDQPTQESFSGTVSTDLTGDVGGVVAALSLGQSNVALTWDFEKQSANVSELKLDPKQAKAFVASWPLKVPLQLKGTLGPKLIDVTVEAGRSRIAVGMKPSSAGNSTFALNSDGLDLKELLGAQLQSSVALSLQGQYRGSTVDQLIGDAVLNARWLDSGGTQILAAGGTVKANAGVLTIPKIDLTSIGAHAVLAGTVSQKTIALGADVSLTDATALSKALKSYANVETGAVSGKGALRVEANGPLSNFGVLIKGSLQNLKRDDVGAATLTVNLRLPDVRKPLNVDGMIDVKQLKFGTRELKSLNAQVTTTGREVSLTLKTEGLGNTSLALKAQLDSRMTSAELKELTVQSEKSVWVLQAPTRISWADDQFIIEHAVLASGSQRLALDVAQGRKTLTGQLQFAQVQIESLPDLLLPADLHARGLLNGTATFNGPWPSTAINGELSWVHGAAYGIEGIELTATAAMANETLTAKANAQTSVGTVEGTLTLPLSKKADSVDALITISNISLEQLQKVLKQTLPVTAQGLSLTAKLSGKLSEPDVALTLRAAELKYPVRDQQLEVNALEATLISTALGAPTLTLSLSTLGGTASATFAPELTLASLRERRPTASELKTLTATAHLELHALQLSNISTLHLVKHDDFTGLFNVTADFSGSFEKPTLEAKLDTVKLGYGSVNAIDASLIIKASPVDSVASLTASHAGKPIGTVDVRLRDGLQSLQHLENLGSKQFTARALLNETDLKDLLPRHEGLSNPPMGRVKASAVIEGTFDAPTMALESRIEGLQFSKVPLGIAVISVSGDSKAQKFEAHLGSPTHEDFLLMGTTGLHWGLAELRGGLEYKTAPIDARFTSKNFDIAFLSGIHPMVRTVGGTLSASGSVTGTLGEPVLLGDATLSKGRIALAGRGEYREIELKASVTNEALTISEMQVKSGSGLASLIGSVKRQQSGGFRFQFDGFADHFPVVNDDQLLATTSLKELQIEGQFTDTLVDVQKLSMTRVDVELPDVKRKDLQDLERPKDILILRGRSRLTSRDKEALEGAVTAQEKPRTYRAVIDLPRNLWIKSSDLELEVGLSDFRVEYSEEAQIFGRASVLRGKISVIGRQFEVSPDSQVNFAGPATQPYINVTAIHTNEREKVKVTVNVVGRGKDVKLVATSNPNMPESEIYTLLATGRRELRKSASASISPEQALSVIGSLAKEQLQSVFAAKLPFDVLSFETGSEDNKSARLEFGKYFTDTIYVGYQWQPYASQQRGENVHTVRAEWQINDHWTGEASAGTAPAVGADFVWSNDY